MSAVEYRGNYRRNRGRDNQASTCISGAFLEGDNIEQKNCSNRGHDNHSDHSADDHSEQIKKDTAKYRTGYTNSDVSHYGIERVGVKADSAAI